YAERRPVLLPRVRQAADQCADAVLEAAAARVQWPAVVLQQWLHPLRGSKRKRLQDADRERRDAGQLLLLLHPPRTIDVDLRRSQAEESKDPFAGRRHPRSKQTNRALVRAAGEGLGNGEQGQDR